MDWTTPNAKELGHTMAQGKAKDQAKGRKEQGKADDPGAEASMLASNKNEEERLDKARGMEDEVKYGNLRQARLSEFSEFRALCKKQEDVEMSALIYRVKKL